MSNDDRIQEIADALAGKKTRKPSKQVAESLIVAKLYEDRLIVVDEDKKWVGVDVRHSTIEAHYGESGTTYDDIKDIVTRMVRGLEMAGYKVEVRRSELLEMHKLTMEEANEDAGNGEDGTDPDSGIPTE
jgi:hypothetical protein